MTLAEPEANSLPQATRLTALAHGGGCGCKLAPAVLRELLHGQYAASGFPQLLVGNGTADDAAVWQLDDGRCLVATTDFFMPIVDDPHDFGRIAATNAMSDIYAMGARPLFALAILGIPLGKIDTASVREILAGGAAACAQAGIPVAGGHSIDSAEPIYGLAVIGECSRESMRSNGGAQAGDALILTKPLGVGIYSAAYKRGELGDKAYAEMIAITTKLNAVGARLGQEPAVHALTDVTGFGILGHGLEMARASGVRLEISAGGLPLLSRAADLARAGIVTGASARNWASVEEAVSLPGALPGWQRDLLTDPQTSGGLLIAAAPDHAERIVDLVRGEGFSAVTIIGRAVAGAPGIAITD
jgi:selenide,water dikinase